MSVWIVVGVHTWDYEADDWHYAVCATEAIAERKLEEAQACHPDYDWEIEEWEVVDK